MNEIFGIPQLPLTGSETVTVQQIQNGQVALCTMPLSALAAPFSGGSGNPTTSWAAALPTEPTEGTKTFWLNGGVLTFS